MVPLIILISLLSILSFGKGIKLLDDDIADIPLSNQNKADYCNYCKGAVTVLQRMVEERINGTKILQFISDKCEFVLDKNICKGAVFRFGTFLIEGFEKKIFDKESICGKIGFCGERPKDETADEYAKRVLKDKPIKDLPPIDLTAKTMKGIILADIHLDLLYKEGSRAKCGLDLVCCHLPASGFDVKAGLYGYSGQCDVNIDLYNAAIDAIYDLKPDFIILMGDNPPHNMWNVTKEEVVHLTQIITDAILKRFNGRVSVYPAIGNHDAVPMDNFTGQDEELLMNLADTYKPFLTQEAYKSLHAYGYYSQLHPNSNLRFISINSLLCDSFNFNLFYNTTLAEKMFKWLEDTLILAEKNNEIVYFINHIPLNNQQGTLQCGKRLIALLDRFQYIVRGHFSGHTHSDEVNTLHEYFNRDKIFGITYVIPSLTTFGGLLPSFRLLEIDSNTKMIKDNVQYRLNLTISNQMRKPIWYISYRGTQMYNVSHMNEYEKISKIQVEGDYIIKLFAEGEKGYKKAHKKSAIKQFQCQVSYDSFEDVIKCTDYALGPRLVFYAFNLLMKEWKEIK